ncbi:hypothetical protein CGRA01v4_10132 [Colletotrichum graminicola]|nr:hypothetical protein CGRA01v4_10132 [Colletotrichum graminicola]
MKHFSHLHVLDLCPFLNLPGCLPASNIAVTQSTSTLPSPLKKSQVDASTFTSSTNLVVAAFREGKKIHSQKKKKNLGPQILFLQHFSPPLPQPHNLLSLPPLRRPTFTRHICGHSSVLSSCSGRIPFRHIHSGHFVHEDPSSPTIKSSNRNFAFTVVHIFLRSPQPEHLRNATLLKPTLLLDLPSTQLCYIVTRNTASTTPRNPSSCSPLLNSSNCVPPSDFSSPHFAQQKPPRQLHWTSISRSSCLSPLGLPNQFATSDDVNPHLDPLDGPQSRPTEFVLTLHGEVSSLSPVCLRSGSCW